MHRLTGGVVTGWVVLPVKCVPILKTARTVDTTGNVRGTRYMRLAIVSVIQRHDYVRAFRI